MRFYLYKKTDIYDLDSFIKENQKGSQKYRTIKIAEEYADKKIRMDYKSFIKKHVSMKDCGTILGNNDKYKMFIKFINKNQVNENENLYSIIGKDGSIYEPKDFLKLVYEK